MRPTQTNIRHWLRHCLPAAVIGALLLAPAQATGQQVTAVRAWEGTLELPSSVEGPPDPNPSFDYFRPQRINYPYPLRTNLTPDMRTRAWQALFIENEYLRCVVMPELGGHLYSCTDLVTDTELFYANPSIKLTQIGYRGAWAAFGVEFNYPVSHNWMSTSPVDWALREHGDGAATIQVGNIDRVYGTEWRVNLTLRPGQAALEQHTLLSNRSDVRHRYYWWTNAAVRATDESLILYPMRRTASHGFTNIDTWPVDQNGIDNSLVGNHLYGPVSRFSHGSREPFMAVYHPDSETGVVHISAPTDLGPKKIWSWGGDDRGLDWRRALSDDNSAYVEIQAGLFRNQETYGFLDPQEEVAFVETWAPLRGLGGLSRANERAQVHLCRMDVCGELPAPGLDARGSGALRVRLNVTRQVPAARVEVARNGDVLWSQRVDLEPSSTFDQVIPDSEGSDLLRFRLIDGFERVLIEHTEGVYDYDPAPESALGPQPVWSPPSPEDRSESDDLRLADGLERDGRRVEAWEAYGEALRRHPGSVPLTRAAGRLTAVLSRDSLAVTLLESVVDHESTDAEAWYYLGLAYEGLDRPRESRAAFERALTRESHRAAARIQLGLASARSGNDAEAAEHFAAALSAQPRSGRAAALLAVAMRRTDRQGAATATLDSALGLRPSDSFLRLEAARLAGVDPALQRHLAIDPERILEIAADYLDAGWWAEALAVLDGPFPALGAEDREPGQPAPERYAPLVYWSAWALDQSGGDATSLLAQAQGLPLQWTFVNRRLSRRVLRWALVQNPDDASAAWLLGGLELQSARPRVARALWERALETNPEIPAAHNALGRLLLQGEGSPAQAVAVLRAGTRYDPTNMGVYLSLDDAMGAAGADASARADALLGFGDRAAPPAALVYRTARRLAEAGRFDEADALFVDRFFPREEGGINVRQVYLEVKLGRAEALAANGSCAQARLLLKEMMRPDPTLEFTRDGLALWLERGGLSARVSRVKTRCEA